MKFSASQTTEKNFSNLSIIIKIKSVKQLHKSKLGIFLAGIYVLFIILALIEAGASPPHAMTGVAFLVLSAPWSFLLLFLFESLGILTEESVKFFGWISIFFGILVNTSVLFLIGCLLTKALRVLSSFLDRRLKEKNH